MDTYYDFEVSKEDELILRNDWKLAGTCQFINMFRAVLKIKEPITPYDLEQSLLRPQHDPICGEMMSKLLAKRPVKKDSSLPVELGPVQILDYDTWNLTLAKRFAMMHKNYRKFSIRYLGEDPLLKAPTQQQISQGIPDNNEEEKKDEVNKETSMNEAIDTKKMLEESKDTFSEASRKRGKKFDNEQSPTPSRRNTRRRTYPEQPQKVENGEHKVKQQEQLWSSDLGEHLIQFKETNVLIKFGHDNSSQWKTDMLQMVKFFKQDLEGQDPFFIGGQEGHKEDQSNYCNNFVDVDIIEEYEEQPVFEQKIEIQYKKFHEISIKQRLNILYYLCQSKLDTECPLFMQEVSALQQTKPQKNELPQSQSTKLNDELKQLLDPLNLAIMKPLGHIQEGLVEVQPGFYFYFPHFQDTRIYRQTTNSEGVATFELFCEYFDEIQIFSQQLAALGEKREDCKQLGEKLEGYFEYIKKFAEDMKRKEACKIRKLQSQIRSRKLLDRNRKKLQIENKGGQVQTDYLHHTQGNVMTRKQINSLKTHIKQGGKEEDNQRASARERLANRQKEKQEKERQDRERRLAKREHMKKRMQDRQLRGGLRKRGKGDDSENDYDDEEGSYGEELVGSQPSKRARIDTGDDQQEVEEENPGNYDIVLQGYLLLIYQRDQQDQPLVNSLNMVLKGSWKLSVDEEASDFIYKRVGLPQNEDLLTEYFCEDKSEILKRPCSDFSSLDVRNQQCLLEKMLDSQSHYQGYFNYNETEVNESFSVILKKPSNQAQGKGLKYELCGYGENEIGPFTLEGFCQMLTPDKIHEKDGLQNFKKVKLAKFTMQKSYKTQILEELVDDVRTERNEFARMEAHANANQKGHFYQQVAPPQYSSSQDILSSQENQQVLPKVSPTHQLPAQLSEMSQLSQVQCLSQEFQLQPTLRPATNQNLEMIHPSPQTPYLPQLNHTFSFGTPQQTFGQPMVQRQQEAPLNPLLGEPAQLLQTENDQIPHSLMGDLQNKQHIGLSEMTPNIVEQIKVLNQSQQQGGQNAQKWQSLKAGPIHPMTQEGKPDDHNGVNQ